MIEKQGGIVLITAAIMSHCTYKLTINPTGMCIFEYRKHHIYSKPNEHSDETNSNNKIAKRIWEPASSPPLMADPLISAIHNCLTVFARWH